MRVADWDAIIVGAGPAGSALACRLGTQRRVLLLERAALRVHGGRVAHGVRGDASPSSDAEVSPVIVAPFAGATSSLPTASPFLPRIGESLPGAARVLLQRFGLLERFLAAGHVERGATVSHWDDGEPVWFDHLRDPSGPGWHLDRNRFDADLREAAIAAGAVLVDGCGPWHATHADGVWQIERQATAQIHRAPVLVDATGRNAAIARQLGIPRRVDDELICLHAYLPPCADDEDDCTRVCADRNGWWYSVRVPSGQRVLAFHLDADDAELHALRSLPNLLAKARQQVVLADVLPVTLDVDVVVHARPAGSAMLDFVALARTASGFFAIGDAGLSFDPIASQGMFHALASAESAAKVIAATDIGTDAAEVRAAFLAEQSAVSAHYRRRLQGTYSGPSRYRGHRFWAMRRAAESGTESGVAASA
ncbi:tryptophan 7-halogenase [Tahibacter sp. UC22_41]|uniref:NAD(P)/FAD-dependent oxidoreductase n=1 Tax=Tahibacter sp. UC22_41 TaxID=3350178 RepID=UPI0036DC07E4